MTDRNKFEEMLERLINEDRAGAEELFHEIVVEKSRDIYQNIIESEDEEVDESEDDDLDEATDEEVDESEEDLDESTDEEVDESEDDDLDESEDDDLDEMFGLDEFEAEADPMGMAMGGDETDDMMGDIEMGGDDEEGEEDAGGADEAFADLEDALEALKAEFDAMMGDDEGEEGEEGDMDDMDGEEEPEEEAYAFESTDEEVDEATDEEVDEATDEEVEESKAPKSASEQMREYVEKVAPAKMGDNGVNNKSSVASKNDMGGSSANILRGDTEAPTEANKGNLKGSALTDQNPKDMSTGNVNVPGGKAGKTAFKKSEPGHGAEKKGKPETADKSAGSTIKSTVRKS